MIQDSSSRRPPERLIDDFIDLVRATDPWTERVAEFTLILVGGMPRREERPMTATDAGAQPSLVPRLHDRLSSLHHQGFNISLVIHGLLRLLDAVFERRQDPSRIPEDTLRILKQIHSLAEDPDAARLLDQEGDARRSSIITDPPDDHPDTGRLAAARRYFEARGQLTDADLNEQLSSLVYQLRTGS